MRETYTSDVLVKKIAAHYDLTLPELAEKVRVSASLLQKISQGLRPITWKTAFKFERALGLNARDLVEGRVDLDRQSDQCTPASANA